MVVGHTRTRAIGTLMLTCDAKYGNAPGFKGTEDRGLASSFGWEIAKGSVMYRRRLVTVMAMGALAPLSVWAVPPRVLKAENFAAVAYSGREGELVKTVSARVSVWRNEDVAEELRQLVLHGAGWVPQGEFYATTPVAAPIPQRLESVETGFATWSTTVGVAGVQTDHALLAWRDGLIVAEVRTGTHTDGPADSLAADLGILMWDRRHILDIGPGPILPGPADLPKGMIVEYWMTPEGTVNGAGTPIPVPEESPVP